MEDYYKHIGSTTTNKEYFDDPKRFSPNYEGEPLRPNNKHKVFYVVVASLIAFQGLRQCTGASYSQVPNPKVTEPQVIESELERILE